MRIIARVPVEWLAEMDALDPTRDFSERVDPAEHGRAGEEGHDPGGSMNRQRTSFRKSRRDLAILAGAAVAAVIVGAVVAPALLTSDGTGETPVTSLADTVWATFPADRVPRPVVLLRPPINAPEGGFDDAAAGDAFVAGNFELPETVPAPPAVYEGYPIGTFTDSLGAAGFGGETTIQRLKTTNVELTSAMFDTDRSGQLLPAWRISFEGASDPAFVLAVADPARVTAPGVGNVASGTQPLFDDAVVDADQRSVTIWYEADHTARSPCDSAYTSEFTLTETREAVQLTVVKTVSRGPEEGTCPAVGIVRGVPVPGVAETGTFALSESLGGRVLVDGRGLPYRVVMQ